MNTGWTQADEAQYQAVQLAEHLRSGGQLAPLASSSIMLGPGESAFAEFPTTTLYRFGPESYDVKYEHHTPVHITSPIGCLNAAQKNWRHRRVAADQADHRWRPIMWGTLIVTSARLVLLSQITQQFWYTTITSIRAYPTALDIGAVNEEPVRFDNLPGYWTEIAVRHLGWNQVGTVAIDEAFRQRAIIAGRALPNP